MNWFVLSLLAIIFWGVWGFFGKISSQYINSKSIFLYGVLGSITVAIILWSSMRFKVDTDPKGTIFAIMGGGAAALAGIFFFYALAKGKASIVVPLTAMYPAITILLSYIFFYTKRSQSNK